MCEFLAYVAFNKATNGQTYIKHEKEKELSWMSLLKIPVEKLPPSWKYVFSGRHCDCDVNGMAVFLQRDTCKMWFRWCSWVFCRETDDARCHLNGVAVCFAGRHYEMWSTCCATPATPRWSTSSAPWRSGPKKTSSLFPNSGHHHTDNSHQPLPQLDRSCSSALSLSLH